MKEARSQAIFPGRSQILFAVVFLTRYLDLFTSFISVYNTTMKVFFLASSIGTVYLMFVKFKATQDHNHDTFRVKFLVGPTCYLPFPFSVSSLDKKSQQKAPWAEKKSKSTMMEVVTHEYTINLHKRLHGIGFKYRAPRAVKVTLDHFYWGRGSPDLYLEKQKNISFSSMQ